VTTGGFAMAEVELEEAAERTVRLAPDQAGLALLIRDRGAFVGFELLDRRQLPDGEIAFAPLIPDSAREAAIASRLTEALSQDGLVPSVTVAICTKDRSDWVARLLASLAPLRQEQAFELLVVDNAPSDNRTREVCARHPAIRYVREPVPGLNFGRNRALAEATGEVIAYLDDDVVVDRGWLAGLRQAWRDNPDAGLITGLVMPLRLDTAAQVLFERRGGFRRGFRRLRYGRTAYHDRLHPFGAGKFGAGANMSMRCSLVRQLGGFDEALDTGRPLPGGGDLDIFFRVLQSGAMLAYEPRMAVFHDHREELATLARQYYTWGLGFCAFVAKSKLAEPAHRQPLNAMLRWWFVDQGGRLLRSAVGREDTPFRMVLGELRGGVQGLLGEYARSRRRSSELKAAHR
jgi:glycosyltransferase involved in cell wall biosynthesis